jgi:hypothetical protein
MKSIFTFLFLTIFSLSIFAQNTNSVSKKNDAFSSALTSDQQSFSIQSVYPNPVKDFVNIDIQSKIAGNVQITLYNILGTEIKKWDSNNLHQGAQKLKLDLSIYKAGVYILRISAAGQICSQVIKKN